ncbi:MAG: hypothetical protein DRP09_13260 [Candidatus Thorarchaeota archaeon]|nr:MAG: hypothetical protein DRP09_13260 [Candidatus Thorarchaeota archaeon]
MPKELLKMKGKIYIRNADGNLVPQKYEEVLYDFLQENRGKEFDTYQIAEALNIPYNTIQPKLKFMATSEECPSQWKIKMHKLPRGIAQRGRRKYTWSVD